MKLLLIAALLAAPLQAATIDATPATFANVIKAAAPGDIVNLSAADFGAGVIVNRTWQPALTINASKATFSNATGYAMKLTNVQGLNIVGGTYTRAVRGIVMDSVRDVKVMDAILTGLQTDGINIATGARVLVDRVQCADFKPKASDHPDCVQMWSVAGKTPTSDITITRSVAIGAMQGFAGFNHVRNGVNDGGFDRIKMTDNTAAVTYNHGVVVYDCRGCTVTGNRATSLGTAWTQVAVYNCTGCTFARNNIGPRPPKP
jgi:hypothetical protein